MNGWTKWMPSEKRQPSTTSKSNVWIQYNWKCYTFMISWTTFFLLCQRRDEINAWFCLLADFKCGKWRWWISNRNGNKVIAILLVNDNCVRNFHCACVCAAWTVESRRWSNKLTHNAITPQCLYASTHETAQTYSLIAVTGSSNLIGSLDKRVHISHCFFLWLALSIIHGHIIMQGGRRHYRLLCPTIRFLLRLFFFFFSRENFLQKRYS